MDGVTRGTAAAAAQPTDQTAAAAKATPTAAPSPVGTTPPPTADVATTASQGRAGIASLVEDMGVSVDELVNTIYDNLQRPGEPPAPAGSPKAQLQAIGKAILEASGWPTGDSADSPSAAPPEPAKPAAQAAGVKLGASVGPAVHQAVARLLPTLPNQAVSAAEVRQTTDSVLHELETTSNLLGAPIKGARETRMSPIDQVAHIVLQRLAAAHPAPPPRKKLS